MLTSTRRLRQYQLLLTRQCPKHVPKVQSEIKQLGRTRRGRLNSGDADFVTLSPSLAKPSQLCGAPAVGPVNRRPILRPARTQSAAHLRQATEPAGIGAAGRRSLGRAAGTRNVEQIGSWSEAEYRAASKAGKRERLKFWRRLLQTYLDPGSGIEVVAQSITDKVEREYGEHDGSCRKQH